jgi:hypothetical protein
LLQTSQQCSRRDGGKEDALYEVFLGRRQHSLYHLLGQSLVDSPSLFVKCSGEHCLSAGWQGEWNSCRKIGTNTAELEEAINFCFTWDRDGKSSGEVRAGKRHPPLYSPLISGGGILSTLGWWWWL